MERVPVQDEVIHSPVSADAASPLDAGGLELLTSGPSAHEAMVAAIDRANLSIHLEMYAISGDAVGARFVQALARAAKRGARVTVVVDGWGSLWSGRSHVRELREAGCTAKVHNPLSRMLRGKLGSNHRKLLIVDAERIILGGINLGAEFATWDDVSVSIPMSEVRNHRVQLFLSGFRGGRRLERAYIEAISSARTDISMAHGYFLPDRSIVRALRAARKRGVRVRILVPARSDVPFARVGTIRSYRRLVPAGIEMFEHKSGILHAKAAVIDGTTALIGSFNLDPLSLVNFEVLARIHDERIARELLGWMDERIDRADRVAPPDPSDVSWGERLGAWVRKFVFAVARLIGAHK